MRRTNHRRKKHLPTHHHEHDCICRVCEYIRKRISPDHTSVEWEDVVDYAQRARIEGVWDRDGKMVVRQKRKQTPRRIGDQPKPITLEEFIDFSADLGEWNGDQPTDQPTGLSTKSL